VYVILAIF